jgi:hypothetical protein
MIGKPIMQDETKILFSVPVGCVTLFDAPPAMIWCIEKRYAPYGISRAAALG